MSFMDPAAQLPDRLQKRLDSWKYDPPRWQHQAYGPLNAYFSLKFPPTHFLVKPQALLRKEVPPADDDDEVLPADDDDDGDVDRSFDSIDSHGVAVTKTRLYPDFDIDQYWGADNNTNKQPDIVRVVVEVASLVQDPPPYDSYAEAVIQLQSYLDIVGERWHQRLVGLAILGNRAYLMHITEDDHRIREVYAYDSDDGDQMGNWMSLFDPRVVEVLDQMYELSMNDDEVEEDDDDDEGEDEDDDY